MWKTQRQRAFERHNTLWRISSAANVTVSAMSLVTPRAVINMSSYCTLTWRSEYCYGPVSHRLNLWVRTRVIIINVTPTPRPPPSIRNHEELRESRSSLRELSSSPTSCALKMLGTVFVFNVTCIAYLLHVPEMFIAHVHACLVLCTWGGVFI